MPCRQSGNPGGRIAIKHATARIFLLLCCWATLGLPHFQAVAGAEGTELTVEEAIRLALLRNERVKIAEDRLTAAQARQAKARAFFFPDLTLSGEYTRQGFEGGQSIGGRTFTGPDPIDFSAAISANVSLFDARLFPLYRQAKLEHNAARLDKIEERRLLAFEVADAFLRTLGVQQVQSSAERRLAFAQSTVEDTKARFEAKLVSVNDLTRAELELTTAEREATLAQGETQLFRLQLGYLIDSRIEGSLANPEALLNPPEPSDPDRLVTEAHTRRLDLAADEARIDALEAFAQEPALRIIPNLRATGQFEESIEAGPDSKGWFMGLNLTWLLYDGGERRADRAERKANARIAGLELSAVKRQVDRDIRRALVSSQNDRAVARQAQVAVDIGRRNAEEIAILYRQGLARALEVADANVRLFEAEVALAQARYGLGLSLLNLRAALGFDPLGNEVTP
ncbi:MAG: TolC family protein, partial [Nitrospira sp.]|nr:TolC family protein [Nitrospira sp.]